MAPRRRHIESHPDKSTSDPFHPAADNLKFKASSPCFFAARPGHPALTIVTWRARRHRRSLPCSSIHAPLQTAFPKPAQTRFENITKEAAVKIQARRTCSRGPENDTAAEREGIGDRRRQLPELRRSGAITTGSFAPRAGSATSDGPAACGTRGGHDGARAHGSPSPSRGGQPP